VPLIQHWAMAPYSVQCVRLCPQLPSKGGKGGYRERYPLADVNEAAVGGYGHR
jgi:hypothetical protein